MDTRSRFHLSRAALVFVAAFVVAVVGTATSPTTAAPKPDVLPGSLTGSISWEYANGVGNESGYKQYDLSETFTWSGALVNATPGVPQFARYESHTGSFGYTGTNTFVTTPSADCDVTTTIDRAYGGPQTSSDKVELRVYLNDPPYAVLSADCGVTYRQHTDFCDGSSSDLDSDSSRSIAHGDSGNVGKVKFLPKGKIEVTFDLTKGTKTGRPYEYEKIVARFILTVPCKIDLDAKGIPEDQEESLGALVIKSSTPTTGRPNRPTRQQVTLRRVRGITDDLLLGGSSNRIRVFTAPKGGTEITFNGSDNRFRQSKLPKTLYVEGAEFSEEMRDVELSLTSVADPECRDAVKFTVLWADEFKASLDTSRTNVGFSRPGNDVASPYIGAGGGNATGLRHFTPDSIVSPVAAGVGWVTETSYVVHPKDFDYPGLEVVIVTSVESRTCTRKPGSTVEKQTGADEFTDFFDGIGPSFLFTGTETDDSPYEFDSRIYSICLPGFRDADRPPPGTVKRYRGVFAVGVGLFAGRRSRGQASDLNGFKIWFSVEYPAGGGPPVPNTDFANNPISFFSDNRAIEIVEGDPRPVLTCDLK